MRTEEFEAFVVGRTPALLRFAHLVSADRHAAEDLVQGALAGAFRHRGRLDAGDIEAYVRRSIVNAQSSRWSRLLWRERSSAALPERSASGGPERVDDRLWAVQALKALPPRQRAVLALRYFLDLDEAAIARELGISVGTVKSQASKALRTMRAAAASEDREGAHR